MKKPDPCPFCPPTDTPAVRCIGGKTWWVKCPTCDCSGPRRPTQELATADWDRLAAS